MECIEDENNDMLGTLGKACRAIAVLSGIMIAAWIAYVSVGHFPIRWIYDGNVPTVLKKLLAFSHDRPLEYYQQIADCMVIRGLMVLSTGIAIAMLLQQNVYRRKYVHVLFLMFTATILLATIYVLNPYNRIYAKHGFFHAGIAYQILNGNVPPGDPLFAGYPLHYPWAHAFLVAKLSRFLDISPFYVYAIVNVSALGIFTLLIYKIARLLISDKKACIFASVIAVSASTVLTPFMLKAMVKMTPLIHFMTGAAINKFLNINALPLGQVFFYWSVYLLIRIFTGKARLNLYVMFLLASVGCGFFYPGFMACIMGTIILTAAGRLLLKRTGFFDGSFRPIVASFMILGLACLCVWPYMTSTTSGVSDNSQVFNLIAMLRNIIKAALTTLPVIIIILANRRYLLKNVDRPAMGVLFAVIATTMGCYTAIHISNGAEYKFLLLSLVALGIPGGIAFYRLRQRMHGLLFVILLSVFLLPFGTNIIKKLRVWGNSPVRFYRKTPEFTEKGVNLLHRDPEHKQFYQWIKTNTKPDSVFIDTGWDIPVYAHRKLLVTMDTSPYEAKKGYALDMASLSLLNKYDQAVYNQRIELVRNVYGYENSMDRNNILATLAENNIYVAVRSEYLPCPFNCEGLKEVFRSSQGYLTVYVSGQNPGP